MNDIEPLTAVGATDSEVAIFFTGCLLVIILLQIKAYYHFQYLKYEKGKFESVDYFSYLLFRPWYAFTCLPELFIISWVPILTITQSVRRNNVARMCYAITLLVAALAVFYYSSLVRALDCC